MASSLAPEEGAPASSSPCAAASKNVHAGNRSTVVSPGRHMRPDVAELLLAEATNPRSRRKRKSAPASAAAAAEPRGRARYDCVFEEEPPAEEEGRGFAPPRQVWAKVLGYPWWPGQVFDPFDASVLALRQKQHGDAVLVAFFGDRSFAWADAEDLLPFRDGFPRLADIAGRSSSKTTFNAALDDALDEVSRRVDAGLSCACRAANIEQRQVVQNSGVRRGAPGAAVDAAFARDAFRGEAFVGYVRALAVAPEAGADRLDLAVAAAQLKAFTRWRSAANPELDSTSRVPHGAMVVRGDPPAGDNARAYGGRGQDVHAGHVPRRGARGVRLSDGHDAAGWSRAARTSRRHHAAAEGLRPEEGRQPKWHDRVHWHLGRDRQWRHGRWHAAGTLCHPRQEHRINWR